MSSSAGQHGTYHHGDLYNALVANARALAEEAGPNGITVRALASRAGVSHTAAYHHFANKNEILRAVAIEAFGDVSSRMRAAGDAPDVTSALTGAAIAYLTFALERPAAFRFMWARELCLTTGEPDALEAAQRGLAEDIDEILAAHRDEVVGNDDRLATLSVWTTVHGFTTIAVDTPAFKGAPPEQLAGMTAALVGQLMRGLGSS